MFRTVLALLILVPAIETTRQVAESQAAERLVRTRLQSLRGQARQVRREMQYIDGQLAQLSQEQDQALRWASVEVSSEALANRIREIYDARKAQLQQRQEYLATLLQVIETQIVKRAERPDCGEKTQ